MKKIPSLFAREPPYQLEVQGWTRKPVTITRAELVAETNYDGLTGKECLALFTRNQQYGNDARGRGHAFGLKPTQLAAARELWSLQLKAKVAESAERERQRVVVDQEVD